MRIYRVLPGPRAGRAEWRLASCALRMSLRVCAMRKCGRGVSISNCGKN